MTGTTSRVISECDISGLENGHLVALSGDTNNLLIGHCISIMEEEIEVSWFDGSYTTIWQPSKRRDPNNPRKHVDWTDTVPKSSIILYDFTFTSTGRLRKATVEHLKSILS